MGPGKMELVTHRIEIGGMSLRYADVGEGPPLLVIPGHTARVEGFTALAPALARNHRVLVLDLPGCGESDKPRRRYDLRFYEDTLIAFLDALGLHQVIPVGGSLGGNLVLRLGHRYPDRFGRLVCWAPGSAWEAKPTLAWLTDHLMGRGSFWPVVRMQSRYWYSPEYPDRQVDLDETFAYYRRVMSAGFIDMYWGMAADQLRHSLFDLAPEITQPTLLLWGDQDHGAAMGKGVARLHRLIPRSELQVLEGRRHSLEAECPQDLAERILAFTAAC